jgi:hypothetical protein
MLFVGYVKGQFETPIYEYEGFYYLDKGSYYKSIGNISALNKYFKNRNMKIYKLS